MTHTSEAETPEATRQTDKRLRIPSVLIDAPVVSKPIEESGQLPTPDSRDEVVAYDLSVFDANPGDPASGNLVVSAYFDAGSVPCHHGYVPPPCYAVFGSIEELEPADEVVLFWDGEQLTYAVTSTCWVSNRVDFTPFLSNTPFNALTILTAGGNFDEDTGGYSHTLIVRAVATSNSPELECGTESAEPPPTSTPEPDEVAAEVTIDSLTSPVRPGEPITLTGTTVPGTECFLRMLSAAERRLLGFGATADNAGIVIFEWRIPDHYPAADYSVSIACGGTIQSIDLMLGS